MNRLNQYRFNLQSSSTLTINYNKNHIDFSNINISDLNTLIGYGFNLDNDETICNLKIDTDDTVDSNITSANIKFNIPCIGYFNIDGAANNKVLPELYLDSITSTDSIFNGSNSYNIQQNFYINCNLFVKDDITAFSTFHSSDINLKKDISDLKNSYEIIDKLNPISFKWKKDNTDEVGFIAQEIEEVIPEIVSMVENNKVISETKIIAYLVGAIQELDKELRELESNL